MGLRNFNFSVGNYCSSAHQYVCEKHWVSTSLWLLTHLVRMIFLFVITSFVITGYRKRMIRDSLAHIFFSGEGRHLSGQVKITLGKWILRVTCPNGKCSQNLVSNTVIWSENPRHLCDESQSLWLYALSSQSVKSFIKITVLDFLTKILMGILLFITS